MFLQQEKGTIASSANADLRYLVKPMGFVQEQVPRRFHPKSTTEADRVRQSPPSAVQSCGMQEVLGNCCGVKSPILNLAELFSPCMCSKSRKPAAAASSSTQQNIKHPNPEQAGHQHHQLGVMLLQEAPCEGCPDPQPGLLARLCLR